MCRRICSRRKWIWCWRCVSCRRASWSAPARDSNCATCCSMTSNCLCAFTSGSKKTPGVLLVWLLALGFWLLALNLCEILSSVHPERKFEGSHATEDESKGPQNLHKPCRNRERSRINSTTQGLKPVRLC